MKTLGVLCAVLTAVLAVERDPIAHFYHDLFCPVDQLYGTRFVTYDCKTHVNRDLTKCHYRGQSVSVGDAERDLAPCSKNCRCISEVVGEPPVWVCANVECPEHLGVPTPEGQYRVYEHDKCCSVSTAARNSAQGKAAPVTCTHGGKTYNAGEKFYPEEEPCKVCICGENFKGELLRPFCKNILCDSLLHAGGRINKGCVPVYYGKNGCCPIEWKCPGDRNDVVLPNKTKERQYTSVPCTFGTRTLLPGDTLDDTRTSGGLDLTCKCSTPPYITCIATQPTSP